MKIIKVHDCVVCRHYLPYPGSEDYCMYSGRYFTHTAAAGIPEWCLLEEIDDEG